MAGGGGGVGRGPAVLITSGGGFFIGGFFAFRRPCGFGGGLLTNGLMSSSAFRFVPPLGSGLRFVGPVFRSLAGSAFRLARDEIT